MRPAPRRRSRGALRGAMAPRSDGRVRREVPDFWYLPSINSGGAVPPVDQLRGGGRYGSSIHSDGEVRVVDQLRGSGTDRRTTSGVSGAAAQRVDASPSSRRSSSVRI